MNRKVKLALAGMGVVFVIAFIFFVPFIPTNIFPCVGVGFGYTSISFHLSGTGEVYWHGAFLWNRFDVCAQFIGQP